jgi:excisionase family DNA binding protein
MTERHVNKNTGTNRIAVKIRTAGEMLEVSDATIMRMLQRGELEKVCLGRAVRVSVESILRRGRSCWKRELAIGESNDNIAAER